MRQKPMKLSPTPAKCKFHKLATLQVEAFRLIHRMSILCQSRPATHTYRVAAYQPIAANPSASR